VAGARTSSRAAFVSICFVMSIMYNVTGRRIVILESGASLFVVPGSEASCSSLRSRLLCFGLLYRYPPEENWLALHTGLPSRQGVK
jgi:hypothetical protein